jgi:hypothetical protein
MNQHATLPEGGVFASAQGNLYYSIEKNCS